MLLVDFEVSFYKVGLYMKESVKQRIRCDKT